MDVQAIIAEATKLNKAPLPVDYADSRGVVKVGGKELDLNKADDPVLALIEAHDAAKAKEIVKQRTADAEAEKKAKISALNKQAAALQAEAKELASQK